MKPNFDTELCFDGRNRLPNIHLKIPGETMDLISANRCSRSSHFGCFSSRKYAVNSVNVHKR